MERSAENMPDFDSTSNSFAYAQPKSEFASIGGMQSISRKSTATVKWFCE